MKRIYVSSWLGLAGHWAGTLSWGMEENKREGLGLLVTEMRETDTGQRPRLGQEDANVSDDKGGTALR